MKFLSFESLKNSSFRVIAFCAVLIALFFQIEIGDRRFASPDESRYIEISREMAETNDFVTPRLNGVKYFEKPPLFYWMEAAAIKTFGISFSKMRVVEVALAVFGCVALMLAAFYAYGIRTAIISGGVLATTLLYYIQSRFINLDLSLSVFMSAAMFCYFLAFAKQCRIGQRKLLLLFYAFSGLAVLAKGLVGIVLPTIVILVWLVINNKFSLHDKYSIIKRSIYIPGIILFLLITVPWHIICEQRNPGFAYFYLIYEHFVRYTTQAHCRYQPVWFFIPIVIAGLLPWTGLSLESIRKSIKEKSTDNLFLLSWICTIFAFFSISNSKLIPYILPIFPPIALLTGRMLAEYVDERGFSRRCYANIGFYISMSIIACAVVLGLFHRHLVQNALNNDSMLLLVSLLVIFVILCICWEVISNKIKCGKLGKINHVIVLFFAAANSMLIVNRITAFYQDDRKPSSYEIAQAIKYNLTDNVEVFSYNRFIYDLPIFLNRNIGVIDHIGEFEFGLTLEDHSERFMSSEKFLKKFAEAKNRIFVCMTRQDYGKFFKFFKCNYKIFDVTKDFVLVVNK